MSFFLEDINDTSMSAYDRMESKKKHVEKLWFALEEEVKCHDDIERVLKLANDVSESQAELDNLIVACDMADAARSERMCRKREF